MQNLIKWSSLYAVMSIGVAMVIITGGIDLSIGSVVGLVAVVLAFCLKIHGLRPMGFDWNNFGVVSADWACSWITCNQSRDSTFCGYLVWTTCLPKHGSLDYR